VGAKASIREQHREVRGLPTLEALTQDVRYAFRGLARTPGFTFVAIVTLALGIGANTAIFTLVDQALLRLLPVQNPRELVLVTTRGFHHGATWGDGATMSHPLYAELRDRNDVFTGMFATSGFRVQATVDGRAERVFAELVSGTYFTVLGVQAVRGRTLLPSDDDVPHNGVAVLSHRYWMNRFGGADSAVGKTVSVKRHVLTIVGVAEEGFDGTSRGIASDLFVPAGLAFAMTPIMPGDRELLDDPRMRWLNVFGRLRRGVTIEDAQLRLQAVYAAHLARDVRDASLSKVSDAEKSRYLQNTIQVRAAGDGRPLSPLRPMVQPLWILTITAAIVLLIACANLANLLLARASGRQREFAMRLALGAGRRRLAQQLLVESLLLAFIGGAAGVAVAMWGAGALLQFVPPAETLTLSAVPDARILVFTFVVAVVTGVGFGFAPAVRMTRPDVAPTLKSEAGSVAGGSGRLRRTFVIAQMALSVLLLVGAGLFLRSLNNLVHTDLGFDTARVLAFRVDPEASGYDGERGKALVKLLRQRVESTPGVTSAAFSGQQLLSGSAWSTFVTIEGQAYDADRRLSSYNHAVSPGFFRTMGIPMLAGRDFGAQDERMPPPGGPPLAPRVAIANETFVKRYLDGRTPIGRRIGFGRDPGTPTAIEIVGVVGDAKYTGVRNETPPQLYFPFLEGPRAGLLTMYVQTRDEPARIAQALREAVRQVDDAIPVHDMRTLDEQVDRAVSSERLVASLTAVFGLLATLLATIGLYGVMSYTVARRTREIGVRVALGAAAKDISWLVTREVILLVGMGVASAVPVLWGLTRLVESQLYGVTPLDPPTIALAIGLLAGVAALAGLLPARRAARIDPLVALRYE
jgi:predicted permease